MLILRCNKGAGEVLIPWRSSCDCMLCFRITYGLLHESSKDLIDQFAVGFAFDLGHQDLHDPAFVFGGWSLCADFFEGCNNHFPDLGLIHQLWRILLKNVQTSGAFFDNLRAVRGG
ncbi:hypothetical protein IMSAGC020_01417 [Lachnospiraceae bacterium]|nr:hypothetical protein IMSAGC020_01417 [Lachnospiraceae bacterium]